MKKKFNPREASITSDSHNLKNVNLHVFHGTITFSMNDENIRNPF